MSEERSSGPVAHLTVTVRWGEHILGVEQLQRGNDFWAGGECGRWALPEPHHVTATKLIAWDDDGAPWLHDSGGQRRKLEPDGCASLRLGMLSFDVQCGASLPVISRRPRVARRGIAIHALVGSVMVGALSFSHAATPPDWNDGGRNAAREELALRYLVRAEERFAETSPSEELAVKRQGDQEGGTGTRAKGAEGTMGGGYGNANNNGSVGGHRYGVGGPAAAPHIARQAALGEAAEFGMIGLVNAGAAAPWGRDDTLGNVIAPGGFRDHGVNGPVDPRKDRISTFAIDVDTGSYALARRQLNSGGLPPAAAVRAEEFINYFRYDYPAPSAVNGAAPLTAHLAAAPSPYEDGHMLLRVALQARIPNAARRKPVHLVYLVDTSGSMQSADKIGLALDSLKALTQTLKPGDTVALCTYAGSTREILKPTDVRNKDDIFTAIDQLQGGGGTAMNSGMATAYRMANASFVKGHVNRVVVVSDGDANIGPQSPEEILRTIERYRKKGITLSTIGFGAGNYRDDMMEQLADAGDGNYHYVDTPREAKRVFVEHVDSLLEVVARDVKLQVTFDPRVVRSYRLIGYENRDVADEDFRNDDVDGGEVGMGHSVTALYDLVLYRRNAVPDGDGWVTVSVRHQHPDANGPAREALFSLDRQDIAATFNAAPRSFRLAVAVGGFAEVLRQSPYAAEWKLAEVARVAASLQDNSPDVAELRGLIARARQL